MLMDLARADRYGQANAIYTTLINEDIDFCKEAKAKGLAIVHEAMLSPEIGLWLLEEHLRYPETPEKSPDRDAIEEGRRRDRQKYEVADLILAPSELSAGLSLILAPIRER